MDYNSAHCNLCPLLPTSSSAYVKPEWEAMSIRSSSDIYIPFTSFQRGWSPLMEAARGGFKDIVEELAIRGADLNIRTVKMINLISLLFSYCWNPILPTTYSMQEAGESAIHAATVKGHVDVVRILADYRADLNMPNKVWIVHVCAVVILHVHQNDHCITTGWVDLIDGGCW